MQFEYRWDVDFRRVRPLLGFFMTSDLEYVRMRVWVDIYLEKLVLNPSFAPGVYYHDQASGISS